MEWRWGTKKGIANPPLPEKVEDCLEKDLQTYGVGRKSQKRLTLVVGQKPNGKSHNISKK